MTINDIERLDYSKPPPGYTVDGLWWSHPVPPRPRHPHHIGPDDTRNVAKVAAADGLAAAWAHYKNRNDPPGLCITVDPFTGDDEYWFAADPAPGVFAATMPGGPAENEAEARAAAWAWYDRRLALAERLRCALGDRLGRCDGLDFWPVILTWSDEQVAEVERWLVDSTAEMPEVLRG